MTAVGRQYWPPAERSSSVLVKVVRVTIAWFIGAVLLIAAIGKLLDNRHFAEILAQWRLFPEWSLLGLGVVASLTELLLAIWLFSGWRLQGAAILAILFHAGYSVLTTITVLRGIRLPDCGCFGVFFAHPLDEFMAAEDAILALISFVLYLAARKSSDRLIIALLLCALLSWAGVWWWRKSVRQDEATTRRNTAAAPVAAWV